MLTEGRRRSSLDFGLAKWTTRRRRNRLARDADRRADVTGKGTMLGTLQYMAPEQLEGKEADARTDIFAFGAVLYEMITGKKAFDGKSQARLIAAIMSREPLPMSLARAVHAAGARARRRTLPREGPGRPLAVGAQPDRPAAMDRVRRLAQRRGAARVARRSQAPTLAMLALSLATLLVAVLSVPAFLYFQGPPPGRAVQLPRCRSAVSLDRCRRARRQRHRARGPAGDACGGLAVLPADRRADRP